MKISTLFDSGVPLFSFEFFPPKTEAGERGLTQTIAELRPLEPSFVSVTYGAGGSTRSRTVDLVSHIKHHIGIEAMAHLTCVGVSRSWMSTMLDRLEDQGIENLIALRGDPPKGQSDFVAHPKGFSYANELVEMIHAQQRPFCVAAACYPETHGEASSPEQDLENLRIKVDAGVDFLITQLFLDNEAYFEFVRRARVSGIKVPILAGVMPLTDLSQAQRFGASIPEELAREVAPHTGDPKTTALIVKEFTTEQCKDLIARGAPGIHFYTLNKSRLTRDILV